MYYPLYYVVYLKYFIIFFISSNKKESSVGGPVWYLSLSLKVFQPQLLCFLENHFPQRKTDHRKPLKSLRNVCQRYSAGNEEPLGAQTQVLWRSQKPHPSKGPHHFLAR